MTQQPRPMPTILIHFDERGRITQEALRETDFILNRTVGIDIARCAPPQESCGPPVWHVVQENSENSESMWKNVAVGELLEL
jgi:hypothetical protein